MPRPHLIVNPPDDAHFATFAEQGVTAGADTIERLERALHDRYPVAAVHRRELSGEPRTVWYVYRDGRWVF